ncbi:MAG TPA: amidohydrolase family protein, partial [Vicinamibacterales bacterium]|nr:amidohydrolase family protein [Vicinamibacterales bacterium]
MIVLSGAALVLPDRILSPGTLFIDGDRIADIRSGDSATGHPHPLFAFRGHYIVPGFIDVHVHGVEGVDTLDEGDAVRSIAARLPRYGVTGFCPTTVACPPEELRSVLKQVRDARAWPVPRGARVLPAHLESNFISAEYRGAQPLACLRSPRAALVGATKIAHPVRDGDDRFLAADVLTEIERAAPDVGIVTLAPELEGGLDLIRWLTAHGVRASLGHSGASYEQAVEAIAAGASHATHLFNRMPPVHHRSPGLAGAVLQADEVAAELICDGHHVHPALVRTAIAAKRPSRVMAITDATAVAGLPAGARAQLGRQPITAGESTALLADGTIGGSLTTMDRVFQMLAGRVGLSLVD